MDFKVLCFFFIFNNQVPKDAKVLKKQQRLVVRSCSAQNGDVDGFPPLKPNKLFMQEVSEFSLVWLFLVVVEKRGKLMAFVGINRRLELSMEKGLRLLDRMVLLKSMW